jgi:sugar-specific transcriptional regulator TrmB
MDSLETLKKLGLTVNEINIYSYLLRKGLSSGKEIYSENEMDKSSAYEAIHNLKAKSLVYTVGETRNQLFGAIPADKLYEILKAKEAELSSIKSGIDSFVSQIDEIAKQNFKNRNIRIIEGEDGFTQWANAKLEAPKGSVIRELVSYKLHSTFHPEYEKYSLEMPKARVLKGISMKSLVNEEDYKLPVIGSVEKSNPRLLKEVRILPKDKRFELPASIATFGNKVGFLRKKDGKFFGVIIEDKLIVSLLNSMFDFIWNESKKI